MNANKTVTVFDDRSELITGIATRFTQVMADLQKAQELVHVVLTGGSVGIDSLAEISRPVYANTIDWSRVHLWWGDERWRDAGDPERNDAQADEALLSKIACPAENIHRFPASNQGLGLEDAARAYSAELEAHADAGQRFPRFDLVFLGVGPDAHIASLFPEREEVRERELTVVPVRNSPKPPPERLSLTLPVINSANRVWLCLAGDDKSWALEKALNGAPQNADISEAPVAGVVGKNETVFLVDRAAATGVASN